jgi:hypothetical protein
MKYIAILDKGRLPYRRYFHLVGITGVDSALYEAKRLQKKYEAAEVSIATLEEDTGYGERTVQARL